MARPAEPAPIEIKKTPDSPRGMKREFEVISPVFGGGTYLNTGNQSHIKDIDRITPVRSAEVKAQLRFWWRAIYGACMGSYREMREREARIFGAAAKVGDPNSPAQGIQVRVRIKPDAAPFRIEDVAVFEVGTSRAGSPVLNTRRGFEGLGYGAFPLRPNNLTPTSRPGVLHRVTGTFELFVTGTPQHWKEFEPEIRDAVECFLAFGGIGGRTRRGFGAVASKTDRRDPFKLVEEMVGRSPPGTSGLLHLVPTFHGGGRLISERTYANGMEALEASLKIFRDFRQTPEIGRNPGSDDPRRPGRSRWPEPEAIRQMRIDGAQGSALHRERFVRVDKFPRAAFGMPIIFHFKDERQGDPADTTLRPQRSDRMASPLILRPYAAPAEGAAPTYRILALRLNVPGQGTIPVELHARSGVACAVETQLTSEEVTRIRPLQELGHGHTDPVRAFLAYFQQRTAHRR